jgi:hypothetical protein
MHNGYIRKRQKDQKKKFEETMTETFANLLKNTNLQIQEAQ